MGKNLDIINKNTLRIGAKYGFSESWRNFAVRCAKDTFMRQWLIQRQAHVCRFCGKAIFRDNFLLHHIDYDHCCDHGNAGQFFANGKKTAAPDCESCMASDRRTFLRCAQRLAAVHRKCNLDILNARKEMACNGKRTKGEEPQNGREPKQLELF